MLESRDTTNVPSNLTSVTERTDVQEGEPIGEMYRSIHRPWLRTGTRSTMGMLPGSSSHGYQRSATGQSETETSLLANTGQSLTERRSSVVASLHPQVNMTPAVGNNAEQISGQDETTRLSQTGQSNVVNQSPLTEIMPSLDSKANTTDFDQETSQETPSSDISSHVTEINNSDEEIFYKAESNSEIGTSGDVDETLQEIKVEKDRRLRKRLKKIEWELAYDKEQSEPFATLSTRRVLDPTEDVRIFPFDAFPKTLSNRPGEAFPDFYSFGPDYGHVDMRQRDQPNVVRKFDPVVFEKAELALRMNISQANRNQFEDRVSSISGNSVGSVFYRFEFMNVRSATKFHYGLTDHLNKLRISSDARILVKETRREILRAMVRGRLDTNPKETLFKTVKSVLNAQGFNTSILSRGPKSFLVQAVPKPNFESRLTNLLHTLTHMAVYETILCYKQRGILIEFDQVRTFVHLRLKNEIGLKSVEPLLRDVLNQKDFAYGMLTPMEIFDAIWRIHPQGGITGRGQAFKTALRNFFNRRRN